MKVKEKIKKVKDDLKEKIWKEDVKEQEIEQVVVVEEPDGLMPVPPVAHPLDLPDKPPPPRRTVTAAELGKEVGAALDLQVGPFRCLRCNKVGEWMSDMHCIRCDGSTWNGPGPRVVVDLGYGFVVGPTISGTGE